MKARPILAIIEGSSHHAKPTAEAQNLISFGHITLGVRVAVQFVNELGPKYLVRLKVSA